MALAHNIERKLCREQAKDFPNPAVLLSTRPKHMPRTGLPIVLPERARPHNLEPPFLSRRAPPLGRGRRGRGPPSHLLAAPGGIDLRCNYATYANLAPPTAAGRRLSPTRGA